MSRYFRRPRPRPAQGKPVAMTPEEIQVAQAETDKKKLKEWSISRTRKTRLKAAINVNTPVAVLKRLSEDEDYQIKAAAKRNPSMHESDDDELLKMANSVRGPTRLKVAANPNATSDILIVLLKRDEPELTAAVVDNSNFDDACFDVLINNIKNFDRGYSSRYRGMMNKKYFKKEWSETFATFLVKKMLDSEATDLLTRKHIKYSKDEWSSLFKHLISLGITDETWVDFWHNAFIWDDHEFTNDQVLEILTHHGETIIKHSNRDFFSEANILRKYNTEEIKAVCYTLTSDEKYLPTIAKDIFIF